VWVPLWDVVWFGSSALLAVFYGAALGNVVRGVPLDASGEFFLPLWTHFGVRGEVGLLDWYTVAVGVLAALALTMHGALWLHYKTAGEVGRRAGGCARRAWYGVTAGTVLVTVATFRIQPQAPANFSAHGWGFLFPALQDPGRGLTVYNSAAAPYGL
jgi:cytochrome d ubiquinol oxidase subunit II